MGAPRGDLSVGATEPSCVDRDYETLVQANTACDPLPAEPATQFAQYLAVTIAAIARLARRAKVAHMPKVPA